MGLLPLLTALWLGILTSISPCPLATNIAAISFVSYRIAHKVVVLLSGILYTIGRAVTYIVIGFLVVRAAINIPLVSNFLQLYINKILGILLILVGMFLLDLLFNIKIPSISVSESWQRKLDEIGIFGSLFLGMLFALAFCPVSAALFFGSLIPLALKANSGVILPLFYGMGTGLPVLLFAIFIALGSSHIGRMYERAVKFEAITKKVTGVIFILVGIYYVLAYIFKLF
ncbi:MAG: aromatic aminobenezylarsenical efflux permease ArsG family transporter [candidate division WOR-3 bacterium]